MAESILKASSLYHVYESKAEDGNVVALRGIHIDIKEGEGYCCCRAIRIWEINSHEVSWRSNEAK